MTYDEFRDKIRAELQRKPDGMTWTELKRKLRLPQKVPNNKWVSRMERDIGLTRVSENRRFIWKLK